MICDFKITMIIVFYCLIQPFPYSLACLDLHRINGIIRITDKVFSSIARKKNLTLFF